MISILAYFTNDMILPGTGYVLYVWCFLSVNFHQLLRFASVDDLLLVLSMYVMVFSNILNSTWQTFM